MTKLRKRGSPAFIELLRGGVSVVPGGGGGGGVGAMRPIVVDPKPGVRGVPVARPAERGSAHVVAGVPGRPIPVYEPSGKPVQPAADDDEQVVGGAGAGGTGLPRVWLYAAAAGVVVLSLVWVVAFKVGESSGQREGNERVARLVQGGGGGENGTKPTTGAGSAVVAPDPLLRTEKAPVVGARLQAPPPVPPASVPITGAAARTDSGAVLGFQAGLNYLVVATLRKADADEAAKYLSGQGLAVMILPERGIDANSAQASGVSWEVLILRGYSSPLSATQAERDALEAQVKSLGRRWKAENRKAPTDFAQVFWKRFKGS